MGERVIPGASGHCFDFTFFVYAQKCNELRVKLYLWRKNLQFQFDVITDKLPRTFKPNKQMYTNPVFLLAVRYLKIV